MGLSDATHKCLSFHIGQVPAQELADCLGAGGVPGPQGPQGETGARGPQGMRGLQGIPGPTLEEMAVERSVTIPSVAGQQTYHVPLGFYFRPLASEIKVEVSSLPDVWNELQFGVDFVCRHRNGDWVPTVADAAFGVTLTEGTVPAGWLIRLTWQDRRLLFGPTVVTAVKVGDAYTNTWGQMSPTMHPDGVTVPAIAGMCVEFWRWTPKSGGNHAPAHPEIPRDGRRFIPYYRAPVGQFTVLAAEFGSTLQSRRKQYRVCYYNPLTGARSPLSADVVVVGNSQGSLPGDWAGGKEGLGQKKWAGSVWIK